MHEATSYRIEGESMPGWSRRVMQAVSRNLPWHNIATELVDNSLANRHPDRPCIVRAEWTTKGVPSFAFTDNGRGSKRPDVFLRPGLSGGNHDQHGNSTFGTGLFACEAHLAGRMQIWTEADDRLIRAIQRTILEADAGDCQDYPANSETRLECGIPEDGGTVVRFSRYRKRGPTAQDIDRIVRHLGRCYATVLAREDLAICVSLNGKDTLVFPEARPNVLKLYKEAIEIDGHRFAVEWGVTARPNADAGCRLIYGGKFFDTTSIPCGDYNLGRFYAAIRIPHSTGQDCMDLLKRSVEKEFMDDLYERLADLFEPALQESHRLCTSAADQALSDRISRMLSCSPKAGDGKQSQPNGTEDRREFNGRDPDGDGVKPCNSGRKRRGRKKSSAPNMVKPDWAEMGDDGPMAKYEAAGNRLTFNASHPILAAWRADGREVELAQLGAAHVAEVIANTDDAGQLEFAFNVEGTFADIYKQFIERIASWGEK